MAPSFIQKYAKFLVAAAGVVILYGGPALDIIETADLTTWKGIGGAVVAALVALGVRQIPNQPE
jgi:hypothetical protein